MSLSKLYSLNHHLKSYLNKKCFLCLCIFQQLFHCVQKPSQQCNNVHKICHRTKRVFWPATLPKQQNTQPLKFQQSATTILRWCHLQPTWAWHKVCGPSSHVEVCGYFLYIPFLRIMFLVLSLSLRISQKKILCFPWHEVF